MTEALAEVLGVGFLIVWIGIETLWDHLKSVVIPIWLVLPPVLLGASYLALSGKWYIAAAVVAALLLHLSKSFGIRLLGTALLLAASLAAGSWVLAVGFVLYWALWELNLVGGADSLAAYAALLFVPRWEMFAFLLAGIFLWAMGILIVTYRGRLVERFKRLALRVYLRDLPSESELNTEGKPTVGGIWTGVVLYGLWRLLA